MKITSLKDRGISCILNVAAIPRIRREATTPAPVSVSFEFFPPADAAGAARLAASAARLAPARPRFVSVTHGADGSSRARTLDWVRRLSREWGLPVVPHLACAGATRSEVRGLAERYWRESFRALVALRGDAPAGASAADARGGYRFASELVADLRRQRDFEIIVAAYPEGHPDSGTIEADIDSLRRKADPGACRAITQFFFDADAYLRYRDRCRAAGIAMPIVPGILPIRRFGQVLRFAERCGATVPRWLRRRFDGLDEDPETARLIAAHTAIEQVRRLLAHEAQDALVLTLNHADLSYAVCHALDLRGQVERPRVA
jgi:methylenetetrahydrofolate reductase (NADPH)